MEMVTLKSRRREVIKMIKRRAVLVFALLLLAHLIHVFEEAFGKAYFIEGLYNGLSNFLIINFSLLLIPIILLYFVFLKKKIAYYFSIIYAGIMIVDGLDHVIRWYAGFYSGFALIVLGVFLVYYLYKELKNPTERKR